MFCFSQPEDLVADLFAETFSTVVACFMVPCDRVFAACEADPERFSMLKGAATRESAKAALNAEKVAELSEKAAEAAAMVPSLGSMVAIAHPLCFTPNKVALSQCRNRGALSFLGSPWLKAEFAVLQRKH